MKRTDGLYWVRLDNFWTVAEYHTRRDVWFVIGEESRWYDSGFDEIDERKIERDGQEQESQEQEP